MKKINDTFVPSATEIKKAQAHARAVTRQYPEYSGFACEVEFDAALGEFYFHELSAGSWIQHGDEIIDICNGLRGYCDEDGDDISEEQYIETLRRRILDISVG